MEIPILVVRPNLVSDGMGGLMESFDTTGAKEVYGTPNLNVPTPFVDIPSVADVKVGDVVIVANTPAMSRT